MTSRRIGRPPRASGPAFDHAEVERIIRDGELVPQPEGPPRLEFPGPRELGRRYGVTPSAISRFASRRGLSFRERARSARPANAPATTATTTPRGRGRPRKDAERVPWDEIDRILVEGEPVKLDSGTIVHDYPSGDELAARFGVHAASISRYAKKQRCLERRAAHRRELLQRVPVQLDEAQAEQLVNGTGTVTGDPDEDYIVARRIIARRYRRAAEEDEIRANDPIVVRESDKLGREAFERKYGATAGETLQQLLATAQARALEGRKRFEALPPEATGMIIDVVPAELVPEVEGRPGDGDS